MPRRDPPGRPLTELLDIATRLKALEAERLILRQQAAALAYQARIDSNVSRTELARSLGHTHAYVNRVEQGLTALSGTSAENFYKAITDASSGGATDGNDNEEEGSR